MTTGTSNSFIKDFTTKIQSHFNPTVDTNTSNPLKNFSTDNRIKSLAAYTFAAILGVSTGALVLGGIVAIPLIYVSAAALVLPFICFTAAIATAIFAREFFIIGQNYHKRDVLREFVPETNQNASVLGNGFDLLQAAANRFREAVKVATQSEAEFVLEGTLIFSRIHNLLK